MRRVLDLFREQGTVDEMGLGTLRDALADALFPGTSSIHTRLRYALFIPWIYQRLEAKRISSENIARASRNAEIALVPRLLENDDSDGVIGVRAGANLSRLPSHVYWVGVRQWGIFRLRQSQSWYHANFARLARARHETHWADDPGVVWIGQPAWHPRLPETPDDFPSVASFRLRPEDSDFLRGRLEETCRGTLLAWLAREGSVTPAESFWEDPHALCAPERICGVIELARRFSLHVEGIPLLYNLLLARHRNAEHGGDEEKIERYLVELAEWVERERAESKFEPSTLWTFLIECGTRVVEPRQQRFVEGWSTRVASIGPHRIANDVEACDLIRLREHQLKGTRARFHNRARLLEWSGRSGVGRMDFRWFRVRQLLTDLHRGFQG